MKNRTLWTAGAFLFALSLAVFYAGRPSPAVPPASLLLPRSGPLTIAAAGDTILGRPVARSKRDAAFDAVANLIRGATLAITNLEMTLLQPERAGDARSGPGPHWTFGSAREASELRSLGFDVVGQANDHATDYGLEGMTDTSAILAAAGLVAVGSGRDLDQARAPVFLGGAARRIAVLAAAISASPESAATPARGPINGRPGINPLRYAADVTLDPEAYETLRRSAPALQGGSEAGGDQFTLLGVRVKKGTETSVRVVPDARDIEGILEEVGRARAVADLVVLSVHSHEPSNDSDEPAEFFRTFAHQAIDAGASLVVGHGPHRVRGVEVYKGGAILYSLGNFLYQRDEGQVPPADAYDAGLDMYSLAMGMPGRSESARTGVESERWWEGAVATATFDAGVLRSLRLHPIDLGVDLPAGQRGLPRAPAPPRAVRILERLVRLSQPFGTAIRIDDMVGVVDSGEGRVGVSVR